MTTYNGWTNYATWNVNLWIDNDYGTYTIKCESLRCLEGDVTPEIAEGLARDLLGGSTPDLDSSEGCSWDDVNWSEIAQHWSDERRELIG